MDWWTSESGQNVLLPREQNEINQDLLISKLTYIIKQKYNKLEISKEEPLDQFTIKSIINHVLRLTDHIMQLQQLVQGQPSKKRNREIESPSDILSCLKLLDQEELERRVTEKLHHLQQQVQPQIEQKKRKRKRLLKKDNQDQMDKEKEVNVNDNQADQDAEDSQQDQLSPRKENEEDEDEESSDLPLYPTRSSKSPKFIFQDTHLQIKPTTDSSQTNLNPSPPATPNKL
eukprot:TRINITY_DN5221_c0_g1_i1.p1 TRINITY_DN5221_c0_g1~~TRINITY_DN5221_c0_g1_i1.p1  ORF type:complete len:230 (-),score=79.10 TRINITY_DN5221_c0_g1_i1:80-769(-)